MPNVRFPVPGFEPVEQNACGAPGCIMPWVNRGLCRSHYYRWARYGDPLGGKKPRYTPMPTCTEPGCDRPMKSTGVRLCNKHYSRNWLRQHQSQTRELNLNLGQHECGGILRPFGNIRYCDGCAEELEV
jgi:hypothetical protein